MFAGIVCAAMKGVANMDAFFISFSVLQLKN